MTMIIYMKLISGDEIVARQILAPSQDSIIITAPFKFYYFMDSPGSMSWRLVRWFPVRSMMTTPHAIDRSMVVLISPAVSPMIELFEQHENSLMELINPKAKEINEANTAPPAPVVAGNTSTNSVGSAPTDPESKEYYKTVLDKWDPPSEAN